MNLIFLNVIKYVLIKLFLKKFKINEYKYIKKI